MNDAQPPSRTAGLTLLALRVISALVLFELATSQAWGLPKNPAPPVTKICFGNLLRTGQLRNFRTQIRRKHVEVWKRPSRHARLCFSASRASQTRCRCRVSADVALRLAGWCAGFGSFCLRRVL